MGKVITQLGLISELAYLRECCTKAIEKYRIALEDVKNYHESRQEYKRKSLTENNGQIENLLNCLNNAELSDKDKLIHFHQEFQKAFTGPRYLESISGDFELGVNGSAFSAKEILCEAEKSAPQEKNKFDVGRAVAELHRLCINTKAEYQTKDKNNPKLKLLCEKIDQMDSVLTYIWMHPQSKLIEFQRHFQDKEMQGLLNNPIGKNFIEKVIQLFKTLFKKGLSSAITQWKAEAKIDKEIRDVTRLFTTKAKELSETANSDKDNLKISTSKL